MKEPKIALVGFGNVGFHLTTRLSEQGCPPKLIVSSDPDKVEKSLRILNLEIKTTKRSDLSREDLDYCIFAIPDNKLQEYVSKYSLPEHTIALHTSGSQSMDVLNRYQNHGVLYPLQTFTANQKVDFNLVPMLIEASSQSALIKVGKLASILSTDIRKASSTERLKIHLAAVIACNFSNKLYQYAEELLSDTQVVLKDFKPLLTETVNKAVTVGADRAQTGPASRGDTEVIENHLNLLEGDPRLKQLYDMMSQAIQESKS